MNADVTENGLIFNTKGSKIGVSLRFESSLGRVVSISCEGICCIYLFFLFVKHPFPSLSVPSSSVKYICNCHVLINSFLSNLCVHFDHVNALGSSLLGCYTMSMGE